MLYEEAVQILADRAGRDDRGIVQAAKVILSVSDAVGPHTTMARFALSDVRTRMWHADQTVESVNPPGSPSHETVGRGPQPVQAFLSSYRSNLIDVVLVAAGSLFVLYLGLTSSIFSNPQQVRAETLETSELMLFLAVLVLGSLWAGRRFVIARSMSALNASR